MNLWCVILSSGCLWVGILPCFEISKQGCILGMNAICTEPLHHSLQGNFIGLYPGLAWGSPQIGAGSFH